MGPREFVWLAARGSRLDPDPLELSATAADGRLIRRDSVGFGAPGETV